MNEQKQPWAIKDADGKTIGIGVPVINKAFYFADVPENDKEMNWFKAMEFAEKRGRSIPSKKEMYIVLFYKDEINAIAAEAGHPDFLSGWAWSSTESYTGYAWYVYFGSGGVYTGTYKYGTFNVVRPVAAL